jgi:predicted O-methyltransferase YrrM
MDFSKISNLEGWCTLDKSKKLYDLIKKTNPKNVVEIGVFGGKSLLSQAFALKDNNNGIIHGIDSWKYNDCIDGMTDSDAINWWKTLDYEKIYNGCVNAIISNGLENYVNLHRMTSEEYSNIINYEIDILHIDGNHEEESSCKDVELYLPRVKKGGYVWFDDANWHQTQKAINLLQNKFNCKLIDKAKSDDPNNFCNLYIKE